MRKITHHKIASRQTASFHICAQKETGTREPSLFPLPSLFWSDLDAFWALFLFCWQDLGEGMTGITGCAKAGELDGFCESVRKFAVAVCGLTENSAQVTADYWFWWNNLSVSSCFRFSRDINSSVIPSTERNCILTCYFNFEKSLRMLKKQNGLINAWENTLN